MIIRRIFVITLFAIFFLVWAAPALAAPELVIYRVYVTNITGNSFVVSWTTDLPADGSVQWGTSTALGNSTADPVASTTTHYVQVNGLTANTTYYFQVQSGAMVNDNGGAYFTITTGPDAISSPNNYYYIGYVYQADGSTPVQNGIVYLRIWKSDSDFSRWLSVRTDEWGGWLINLYDAKNSSGAAYPFAAGDQVEIVWQGGVYGAVGEQPGDIRRYTIPVDQPVWIDMTLDGEPTAINVVSLNATSVETMSYHWFLLIIAALLMIAINAKAVREHGIQKLIN